MPQNFPDLQTLSSTYNIFALNELILLNAVIDTVSHWYKSELGENRYTLRCGDVTEQFCSQSELTPQLKDFRIYSINKLNQWKYEISQEPTPTTLSQIRQDLVLKWLKISNPDIDWTSLLTHIEKLKYRTYENLPVRRNIVITPGDGNIHIDSDAIQKLIDPLTSTFFTYLRVDYNLNSLGFDQISWSEIDDSGHKFYPEFLHPLISILREGEYSIHLTSTDDVIILDRSGLLASYRKGKWFIYDALSFKKTIDSIIGQPDVAGNVIELVLDLSYMKNGALLIYDPDHRIVENHVINPDSIIRNTDHVAYSLISRDLCSINMGAAGDGSWKKRLITDVAKIDGAVIFDQEKILAVGALISPHLKEADQLGARTTAARSVFRYGAIPFKISSDADITIFFKSREGGKCSDAVLTLL